jgi:peptidyl-prolyl cis-trans isomerase C
MRWQPDAEAGRGAAFGAMALVILAAMASTSSVLGAATTTAPAPTTAGSTAAAPRATATAPKPARAAGTDVIARVNGSPILRRDFDLMVQVQFRQRGPGQRRHEDLQTVRDAALDTLIDGELLYQKAAQAKIAVGDAEVREAAARLKTQLGTPEEAAAFLKESGMSDRDLDEQVRRSLMVKRYVDRDVAPEIDVSDAQARAWYDAHPEAMTRPESVRISQIVVRVQPQAAAEARVTARQKIEEILKELKAGKEFAEMARLYSDGPEAKRGGDVGWVWAGGGALPPVERAALALQPGQMSDIVESRRGFHLIKATERRPAGPIPFADARDRIVARVLDEQRDERVRVFVAELRRGARIEKVV